MLYEHRGCLLIATCAHVFDCGVSLGDLAVPLGDSGRLMPLRETRARLVLHERLDVAIVAIGDAACGGAVASLLAQPPRWRRACAGADNRST